ncbi:hypothetical protein B566_EDAN012680 [Ephemera danica]|nr:hypothetical protein B566_EDAN012680 [Ephemera danica]
MFLDCITTMCTLVCGVLRQKLVSWHSFETLRGLKLLGFVTFLCGLAGMSWYIFVTFYKHVPLMPVSTSTVVASVMSFMTGKWGIFLYFSAHHYSIHVIISDDPLLT